MAPRLPLAPCAALALLGSAWQPSAGALASATPRVTATPDQDATSPSTRVEKRYAAARPGRPARSMSSVSSMAVEKVV